MSTNANFIIVVYISVKLRWEATIPIYVASFPDSPLIAYIVLTFKLALPYFLCVQVQRSILSTLREESGNKATIYVSYFHVLCHINKLELFVNSLSSCGFLGRGRGRG